VEALSGVGSIGNSIRNLDSSPFEEGRLPARKCNATWDRTRPGRPYNGRECFTSPAAPIQR